MFRVMSPWGSMTSLPRISVSNRPPLTASLWQYARMTSSPPSHFLDIVADDNCVSALSFRSRPEAYQVTLK